jgi:hypothetical protein
VKVCSAANGWEVDEHGIARAADAMRIRLPVRIYASRGRTRIGTYALERFCVRDDGGRVFLTGLGHAIRVSTLIRDETASRCLWHELIHAWQAEVELGADAIEALLRSDASPEVAAGITRYLARHANESAIPYRHRPCEKEAREGESFHEDICLTRPVIGRRPRHNQREEAYLSLDMNCF